MNEPISDERLAEIRARLQAANTAHPWEINRHDNPGGEINWQIKIRTNHPDRDNFFNSSDLEGLGVRQDAELIVHAPRDLRDLIDEIVRLQLEVKALRRLGMPEEVRRSASDHDDELRKMKQLSALYNRHAAALEEMEAGLQAQLPKIEIEMERLLKLQEAIDRAKQPPSEGGEP